jgi:urocanate hydratase
MAIQNVIGDGFTRCRLVSIHNGGGGLAEVITWRIGMVLDGSKASKRLASMLLGCQQRDFPKKLG